MSPYEYNYNYQIFSLTNDYYITTPISTTRSFLIVIKFKTIESKSDITTLHAQTWFKDNARLSKSMECKSFVHITISAKCARYFQMTLYINFFRRFTRDYTRILAEGHPRWKWKVNIGWRRPCDLEYFYHKNAARMFFHFCFNPYERVLRITSESWEEFSMTNRHFNRKIQYRATETHLFSYVQYA